MYVMPCFDRKVVCVDGFATEFGTFNNSKIVLFARVSKRTRGIEIELIYM